MVRVVLISVLALGPTLAALLGRVFSLPRTVHLSDDVGLTYTGVMATFLLAGLLAIGVGFVSYRQMDDRRGHLAVARPGRWPCAAPGPRGPAARPPGTRASSSRSRAATASASRPRPGGRRLAGVAGHEVVLTREPGGTPEGAQMRDVLLHRGHLTPRAEALLFAADRAHHVETRDPPGAGRARSS